jgi:DNA replicative helicase MCM subunit Mcm2 (Cdc46/Mcm family)
LGYDITTKSIDIDKAEGGVTSSERSKIRSVMAIINTLSQKEKEIKVDKIVDAAVKEGVEDAEEIIERMVREGVLFHPSPGFVQKV